MADGEIPVYPREGTTYPDATGTPVTAEGAIVFTSKYIRDAIRAGFLLTWDPLGVYLPEDRTGTGSGGGDALAFDSAAALGAFLGTASGQIATTTGCLTRGDGGGGQWYWDPGGVGAANVGTIVGASGAGRWRRLFSGPVDVRWFGAQGNGDDNTITPTENFQALLAAFNYVRDNAPMGLYIPSGIYPYLGSVYPYHFSGAAGCTYFGDGDSSVLRNTASTEAWGSLLLDNMDSVLVRNLKWENTAVVNFMANILARNSRRIEVRECSFYMTAPDVQFPPPLGSAGGLPIRTLQGVCTVNCAGTIVTNCKFYRMQAKLAGASDDGDTNLDTICTNNRFTEPYDFAVSYVSNGITHNPDADLGEVIVSNNIVRNPLSSGAFHIGGDGEGGPPEQYHNVQIHNNLVAGNWTSGVTGRCMLVVNLGVDSRNISIVGNTFENEHAVENSTQGIRVISPDVGGSVNGLIITGNTVVGVDAPGIYVGGSGRNVTISKNHTSRSRGIQVQSNKTTNGFDGVNIEGNTVSQAGGIWVQAEGGPITKAVIANNTCMDNIYANDSGILLQAAFGKNLECTVRDNKCTSPNGTQLYGIIQEGHPSLGTGTLSITYIDNDCRGNVTGGLSVLAGGAIGRGNLGTGFPTSTPGAGTWNVGDRTENATPTVGQPKAYVCTVAGNPGTWVSEGNL